MPDPLQRRRATRGRWPATAGAAVLVLVLVTVAVVVAGRDGPPRWMAAPGRAALAGDGPTGVRARLPVGPRTAASRWVAAACSASWEPWSLVYRDGAAVPASGPVAGSRDAPAYPNDRQPITAGRCARGWIMFAVPRGARPAIVEYRARDQAADWALP